MVSGLLGGSAWYVLTLTPTGADFGKLSVAAVVTRKFTLNRSDTLRTVLSLEGPNAAEFVVAVGSVSPGVRSGPGPGEADTVYGCWNSSVQSARVTTCGVSVDLRPASVGVKTATLVATDAHGQKVTAALRGEATAPACQPVLVPCNWTISYIGSIHIHEVDSTINSDRTARYETNVDIDIDRGKVTCQGTRREFEQTLVDGKPVDELNFNGKIYGIGMAAIEFEPDANGKMTYTLTYACATPAGMRESKSLRFGTSETDNVLQEPAQWNDSRMIGEPQPATAQGMTPIIGKNVSTTWDPANKEGGYIKADWQLKMP